MELEFIGAAQTVTGSMHLLRTKAGNILLDCGLFQGTRREANERNRRLHVPLRDLKAVVLSHAHIDHSGALPLLFKQGYSGPVYSTPATRSLCAVMLRDAAAIQAQDARYLNRAAEKEGLAQPHVEPLYDDEDVVRAVERMISVPYHTTIPISAHVQLTFHDAGHVLGSAVDFARDEAEEERVLAAGPGFAFTPTNFERKYLEEGRVIRRYAFRRLGR